MDDASDNRLQEARATFNLDGAMPAPARLVPAKVYRAKVFKSGNSLALRLPAALGLEAGMEMELKADPAGGYSLTRIEPPRRKIDVSGFAGKLPGFKPAPREDFEERPSTIAAREAARKTALGQ
jgi:antitoxin VapB